MGTDKQFEIRVSHLEDTFFFQREIYPNFTRDTRVMFLERSYNQPEYNYLWLDGQQCLGEFCCIQVNVQKHLVGCSANYRITVDLVNPRWPQLVFNALWAQQRTINSHAMGDIIFDIVPHINRIGLIKCLD